LDDGAFTPSREVLHESVDKLPEPALEAAERMLKNYQSWPPKPPMTVERMRRRVELEERLGLSDDGKLLRYSQQIGGPDGKTNHYEVAFKVPEGNSPVNSR
jgi:hypothetical protein